MAILVCAIVAGFALQGCDEKDTLLEDYFCRIYYPKDHASQGLPPCEDVKAAVVSNRDGPLPTLELGDKAKPGLFFVHGWPDSAAEWAAQFGGLCYGPDAKYCCVAVTWQNFHPDLEAFPEADLNFLKTFDLVVATLDAAKLVNPTFVIHDWGAFIGYQIMDRYPDLFRQIIAFEVGGIGMSGNPDTSYQDINADAYRNKNTPTTRAIAVAGESPCPECARWQTAWMFAREVSFGTFVPVATPGDKPMLFIWGNKYRGGTRTIEDNLTFFDQSWVDFVVSTPQGRVIESPGTHWMMHEIPQIINGHIDEWLGSLPPADTEVF